ncbi:ABC transporter related [Methanoregula boonei 6A8]|uniref:ABC transporter related n=1 Tax=Methanoregula boonei (strain DSM 21154 / JCM 14090 / 6A8) TaxID=456442 RepID=A7I7G4_METB6|nr:ATP-binding cassette domain-containing protein [Methanoregula boonei]ABS55675.1 ABC transporter related [Methanoregula boonei 6A8]
MPHGTACSPDRGLPLIEFENVTVTRSDVRALDSLSLTLYEGENTAILGPNGAGKSSLVKAITREYYPVISKEPCTFRFRGADVWDVFALRSHIGIVSNDLQYTFTRPLTGREVILSGFFSSIGLFNREITPAMEERAKEIERLLGIDHLSGRLMNTLSSGEARRFLIGRALAFGPKTLLLDEPTSSLDLFALHTFRQALRAVAQSGTGIILVTHNLHDIIPEISRIVMMKDGRVFGDGKKTEMLTDERIGGLFSVPVHVREENGWYYATGY